MMAELAIFVGGIHGTGKSFFASRYAKKLDINHISAGELIFQQKNLLEKKVANIGKNQYLLYDFLVYLMEDNIILMRPFLT